MGPYAAQFEVVKVAENKFDVLVFSSLSILTAFSQAYPETIFIEKSKFQGAPMIAVPDFDSNFNARAWIGYWQRALSNPEEACKTCEVVQYFFKIVADLEARD